MRNRPTGVILLNNEVDCHHLRLPTDTCDHYLCTRRIIVEGRTSALRMPVIDSYHHNQTSAIKGPPNSSVLLSVTASHLSNAHDKLLADLRAGHHLGTWSVRNLTCFVPPRYYYQGTDRFDWQVGTTKAPRREGNPRLQPGATLETNQPPPNSGMEGLISDDRTL